jgi:hypothetical protein
MESRRLVVWISAGILGFQGATLAFDLLNCTVLSWLFVRQHGLGVVVAPPREHEWGSKSPVGPPDLQGAPGGAGGGQGDHEGAAGRPGSLEGAGEPQAQGNASGAAQAPQASPLALQPAPRFQQASPASQGQSPAPTVSAFDPTGVFCTQPRSRIDEAVSQGLTILAGLALGSSVGGGGGKGNENP